MTFLRNLLATIVGLIIFSAISFFLLVGIVVSTSSDEAPHVEDNTVLYLPLSGLLKEKEEDGLSALINTLMDDEPPIHSLMDILDAINYAKTDDRVEGIYIEPMYLSGGYAALEEIRNALIDFKTSGKVVCAYGEYISESDYYVASVADSFFVNPTGAIEFNGLSANITFFKGMFDKLGVEPQIFRVGEFKSYVEPYIRKNLSEENRLQYTELLNSMYGTYLNNLSESINVGVDELKTISDQMQVSLPKDAEMLGLVHKVGYKDELKSVMKEKIGLNEDQDLRMMKISKYIQAVKAGKKYSKNKIAVIVAEGDIVMGGDEGIVGERYAEEIRRARENDNIKAIVLRINSGGGSMTASDLIWRELMLTKGKKPIIASMSTAAASGGYYIAMPADTIIAHPNTITGSIGIFGMWFNFGDFLENKIGVTHDVVKTGKYSDIYTITRSLRDSERDIIQRSVNEGYEIFTQKVADARNMTQDELKKIAGGRVWSGEQALENGLVDMLGSVSDAVHLATQSAGIEDDYMVVYYPKEKPFFEKILKKINATRIQIALFGTVEVSPVVKQIQRLRRLQGLQARLPGDLEVH